MGHVDEVIGNAMDSAVIHWLLALEKAFRDMPQQIFTGAEMADFLAKIRHEKFCEK